MADDTTASVKITADAAGVQPGVDAARGSIEGLEPLLQQLNAQFADLASMMKESMAQGAASAAEMKTEIGELVVETEKETLSLKEMAVTAKESLETVVEMEEMFSGLGEVLMAAFAVEAIADWAKEFAEAAEHVEHLGQQFGMTTGQIQQLNGIAITTGVSLDVITKGMQTLDKNAVQAASGNSAVATAFKAVGISANDGSTQMQRMMTIADKFKEMDDGPKKVALAMELLGKSGVQLIPILNLGSEGLQEMAEKAKEYDVANTEVSASAQEKGVALAESINEGKLAWQGLTNILGDEFAPVLKEVVDSMDAVIKAMIDSYNEGGTVAVVFGIIEAVVETVGAVINALAGIFVALWDTAVEVVGDIVKSIMDAFGVKIPEGSKTAGQALNVLLDLVHLWGDGWLAVIATIKMVLLNWVDIVVAACHVVSDAFHFNWGAIETDWNAGLAKVEENTRTWQAQMKGIAADVSKTFAAIGSGQRVGAPEGGVKEGEGGAGGDFNPTLGSTKTPKEKDTLVQELDAQLTAKKLAWSMQQDAQDSAQAYSLQSESDFWKDALARQDLTAKDRAEIEAKYLAAHGDMIKADIENVLASYRTQLDAAKGNEALRLQIATEEADFLKQKYGEDSKEYKAAQDQIVKIKREAEEQVRQISEETTKEVQKQQADMLAAQEADAKFRVSMGIETQAQLLAQQREFENAAYDIQAQALQRQKLLTDPTRDPVKYQQVSNQLEDLQRQHQAKLTQIDQQATLQRTAIERNSINQTASLWGTNIAKMITLQQSFGETVRSLYSGMVGVISGALAKVIENWITQQLSAMLFKKAVQSADGVASVTSNAAVAGSAAFASTAAIPIVGPELAPAAAAAAFSATMAFAPIASASGGFDIPSGTNPVTQLHAEEMVLPAHLANPLRSLLGSSPANNNAPPASNDGGSVAHLHLHGDIIHNPSQLEAWFKKNSSAVGAGVRHFVRNGGKTTTP